MEMDPAQLYNIGKQASTDFSQLAALLQLSQSPKYRQIVTEEQRFKVWAHSLGLYHLGHASLDYRVRDAEVVKARLADILQELQSHVCSLDAVCSLPHQSCLIRSSQKQIRRALKFTARLLSLTAEYSWIIFSP
jgi:hypothetical protein